MVVVSTPAGLMLSPAPAHPRGLKLDLLPAKGVCGHGGTQPKQEELVARIAALELEERMVSARRTKLHDRIAIFPSESHQQAERELSTYRRDLHRRIDDVAGELALLQLAEKLSSRRTHATETRATEIGDLSVVTSRVA